LLAAALLSVNAIGRAGRGAKGQDSVHQPSRFILAVLAAISFTPAWAGDASQAPQQGSCSCQQDPAAAVSRGEAIDLSSLTAEAWSTVMRGVITDREVLRHGFTIVRLWGLRTYLRCLRATLSRRPTTFLAVVHASRS